MRKRDIEAAKHQCIWEQVKSLAADLEKLDHVLGVDLDVDNFGECNHVIIIPHYSVDFDQFLEQRSEVVRNVCKVAKLHGLRRTVDAVEDMGEHLYMVFSANK